jgi:SAM-dependent methyltransferase
MKTISDVRADMDRRYADGTAYQTSLPFDLQRGKNIRAATLGLANLLADGRSLLDEKTRTLDVGSGEGGIASFWPHHNITGVEISEFAIEKARAQYPDMRFRCCAIEEFELGAGEAPYDLVVAQESIEHWTDPTGGMTRIASAITRKGHLIITTPNRDSLHCRMSRKLELGEPPTCSGDHIHEFGFEQLIAFVEGFGFRLEFSRGVGLLPYWTMERMFGPQVRFLTDRDDQVVDWFEDIGQAAPAEFCFIQCHRFVRDLKKQWKEPPRIQIGSMDVPREPEEIGS